MKPNLQVPKNSGTIVGIGSIVAEQIFIEAKSGRFHYHCSRGGGSVWNTLGHLALAGFETAAFGAFADDPPGHEAVSELISLGVDVGGLVKVTDKHTRVFTQWLSLTQRHGPNTPQENFTMQCPVCEQTIKSDEVPLYSAAQYRPTKLKDQPLLVCADRLTAETAAAARTAIANDTITALDLGGTSGLADQNRQDLFHWLEAFRIVSMPIQVASWISDGDIQAFVRQRLSTYSDIVALTKGAEGFEIHIPRAQQGARRIESPAPEVDDLIDATGAGDAFFAGVIACALGFGFDQDGSNRISIFEKSEQEILEILRQAPVLTLGGIGARAAFPEYSGGTWAGKLIPQSGRPLADIKIELGSSDPCEFCCLPALSGL